MSRVVSLVADLLHAVAAGPAPGGWTVDGRDPVLPTQLPVGEAAAAALAACGIKVSELWELRHGRRQDVLVDVRHAAASLVSMAVNRLDGGVLNVAERRTAGKNLYRAADDRWVQVHDGFPHLAEGLRTVLGCELDAESLSAAVGRWQSFELEEALNERGLCGAVARTPDEWRAHPQARALGPAPVNVVKIADGPVILPGDDTRPLAGCRVLDLTRLLAGPTCGRMLAELGADVLKISSPALPSVDVFDIDTGHGKRAAFVDLDDAAGVETLRSLIAEADVFVESYRGGSMARRGFGPEALAQIRPGMIAVSVNCFGHAGPWRTRPGFEQIAQAATGLAVAHGGVESPRLLPGAVTDYLTGYLAAFGTLEALRRRATEGGSWAVQASLCQTGAWVAGLPLLPEWDGAAPVAVDPAAFGDLVTETDTPWGRLSHLRPALQLSETPAGSALPPARLGSHSPRWQPS